MDYDMIPNRTMLLVEIEKLEEKTDTGFIKSKDVEPPTRRGVVMATGGEYVLPSGERLPLCAMVGDTVVFRTSSIPYGRLEDNADVICINDKEILVTIKGS